MEEGIPQALKDEGLGNKGGMSQSSGAVVSYLGAGIEGEKTALLRVLGTREDERRNCCGLPTLWSPS